jgi:tetrahydromethanopterin S-methyltransferase subunit B
MPKTTVVTDREVLDSILTLVTELVEQVEELRIQNEELREAISNISLPGVDYGFEE